MGMGERTILAVDDEAFLLEGVASYLGKHGYNMLTAGTGAEALELFEREAVDLVLLDLMLPDISGEDVCRRIRAKSRVPVVMLTAKVAEDEIVEGLSVGADGYITKPFGLKELLARIEALLRRAADDAVPLAATYVFGGGDLLADFGRGVFTKQGEEVRLTATEQRILAAMVKHPGTVFTRDDIIETALGSDFDGFDRSVDAHIKNLRRKIETNPRHPKYLHTAHGLGYKFIDEGREI
jgi:DNA-binding response OmpR family regulator